MWLCDSNIWLSLALSGHVHHAPVRTWWEGVRSPASVGFCRATQQSLLRLLSSAAVLAPYGTPPLTNEQAWAAYQAFRADYRTIFLEEPGALENRWREYAGRATASPKLWMDAYLAAFAVEGGYRLVTTDTAFRQFTDLDVLVLPPRPA